MPPTFYVPFAQFDYLPELGIRSINLEVRSRDTSPASLTRSITSAVGKIDPQLSLTFQPLAAQVSDSLTQERLSARLSACFGLLGLLLAGLGLYGVTAHSVTSRRSEIGIRIALGASATSVARLVLTRAALLVGVGSGLGVALSLWAAKFVTSLIYGLPSRDLVTVIASAAVLTAVAACATWIPPRRALRTDPAAILRDM